MRHGKIAGKLMSLVLALASAGLSAENAAPKFWQYHQVADKDGIYYVGPEVSEPKLVKTVYALYPSGGSGESTTGLDRDGHGYRHKRETATRRIAPFARGIL